MGMGEYLRLVSLFQNAAKKNSTPRKTLSGYQRLTTQQKYEMFLEGRSRVIECLKNDVQDKSVDAQAQVVAHVKHFVKKFGEDKIGDFLKKTSQDVLHNDATSPTVLEPISVQGLDQGEYWKIVGLIQKMDEREQQLFFERFSQDILFMKGSVEDCISYSQAMSAQVENVLDFTQKAEEKMADSLVESVCMFGNPEELTEESVWRQTM